MSSLIGKVNAGSCVVGRRPKWMNSFARPASKRSIWKSISGECSPSQSHDARSLNYRVHVSRLKAFTVSAELSVLFLIVYSGCNWITGQRSHVGSFYFQWEHGIPFVPFMILPYMSIDLFFIAAPFLCRTEEELRAFSQVVIASILIAGLCFLVVPSRFVFSRPHASGWIGSIFDWFHVSNAPYTLLPSLHAAFTLILLNSYFRHTRGFNRVVTMIWFVLIALSPVLTYQH